MTFFTDINYNPVIIIATLIGDKFEGNRLHHRTIYRNIYSAYDDR